MKKSEEKQKTVFVGLSGGVDSSVSAAILKKEGYNVVGVFIKTWQPDFIECTWREERRDAVRVAAHLDIPFLTFDGEAAYRDGVAKYMIDEYKAGRTPNPDVMCNREVKFGAFMEWAMEQGADFVATGHYAPSINAQLKKGTDGAKDQSYFLWTLTSEQLSKILFPIGHLEKSEVRKLAEKFGLPTATKKDSQGVCCLGPLDMKDFLAHYIDEKEGDVLNEAGVVIGNHKGALFFTLGERHGFHITKKTNMDARYYVVAKDLEKNTITVSNNILQKASKENLILENTNWSTEPELGKKYQMQVRYHGEFYDCEFIKISNGSVEIKSEAKFIVSPGQSVVVYNNDICIGGGIVR